MTPDKFYDEFKLCPVCEDPFYRPRTCSPAAWEGRVTCSDRCRRKYLSALAGGHVMTVPDRTPIRREPDPTWRDTAACRGLDPDTAEIFFPLGNDWKARPNMEKVAAAKEICARCPSQVACLEDAVESRDAWSIRGGLTPQERRDLHNLVAS